MDKQGKPIDNRTWEQKESLEYIIKDLHSRYPDAEILGHRDIWGPDSRKWKKMCPCFDVKSWWNEVLEKEKPVVEEHNEPTVEVPWVESGEVVSPGESKPSQAPSTDTRPNPIDFIIQLVTLIIKFIFKRR